MRASSRSVLRKSLTVASSAGAIVAVLALAGTTWAGEARNDEVFSQTAAIAVPGAALNSFDISWVDPSINRYFLADRSNASIDFIDTGTTAVPPSFFLQLKPTGVDAFAGFTGNNDTSGPNGLLTLDNGSVKEIWVGDGPTINATACGSPTVPCSTVKVFTYNGSSTSSTPTHTISTGGVARADELCFDATDHLILMANDADSPPFISLIATQGQHAYSVVKKIDFPQATGGIEQCQWSPRTGKFYLNLPVDGSGPDGAVYVISPKTMAIETKFDIPDANCDAPQGMAIGPDPQILLGCNGKSPNGVFNSVIINEHSGHVMATLPNEGGNDEVWFNSGDGHYFLAGGSFRPDEQLGIVDSQFRTQDQTIQTGSPNGTKRSAHSVAADSNTNLVYVPIPGTGGSTTTVGFQSSRCGETAALQAAGCVAVFGTTNDDRSSVAQERGPDDNQE